MSKRDIWFGVMFGAILGVGLLVTFAIKHPNVPPQPLTKMVLVSDQENVRMYRLTDPANGEIIYVLIDDTKVLRVSAVMKKASPIRAFNQ